MRERLQKLMSKAGIGSRRACEELVAQGRVQVNGITATVGTQADLDVDEIRVDGSRLTGFQAPIYVMLNKPRGVISDEDVGGRWPRARDMIPLEGHLYAVGRLDVQSEGLMLFTNDGDLAHKLTHPRYEHPRIYEVTVTGNPTEKTLDAWRRGVMLEGKLTGKAEVTRAHSTGSETVLEIIIREGRKRQLRRVATALGLTVRRLRRVGMGPLKIGDLRVGSWRPLNEREIAALQEVRIRSSAKKIPARMDRQRTKPGKSRPTAKRHPTFVQRRRRQR